MENTQDPDLVAIADMLYADLVPGTVVDVVGLMGAAKDMLELLGCDSSPSRVLSSMEQRGYLSRKGKEYLVNNVFVER